MLHLRMEGKTKCGQKLVHMRDVENSAPWADPNICPNCARQYGPPPGYEPMPTLRKGPLLRKGQSPAESVSYEALPGERPMSPDRLRRHGLAWRIVDVATNRIYEPNEAIKLMNERERLGAGNTTWTCADAEPPL